jgi:hypothetical protein
MLGFSARSADAAGSPVDIVYQVPGTVPGGIFTYHVTGTALGSSNSFVAGFDISSGPLLPYGSWPDSLTSLTVGYAGGTPGTDFSLSYTSPQAPGDNVGLGLTYPDSVFAISVSDYRTLPTPLNVWSAGVFQRTDAFNNDTDYVLLAGCGNLGSADVCSLADEISQGIGLSAFGLQAVPEPGALAVLAVGLIGLGLAARRR